VAIGAVALGVAGSWVASQRQRTSAQETARTEAERFFDRADVLRELQRHQGLLHATVRASASAPAEQRGAFARAIEERVESTARSLRAAAPYAATSDDVRAALAPFEAEWAEYAAEVRDEVLPALHRGDVERVARDLEVLEPRHAIMEDAVATLADTSLARALVLDAPM
jgi:hypothetical protein